MLRRVELLDSQWVVEGVPVLHPIRRYFPNLIQMRKNGFVGGQDSQMPDGSLIVGFKSGSMQVDRRSR